MNTIAENRLDAAFIRTKAYQNPGIRILDLLKKPMVLASPEGGPLSKSKKPVAIAEIADLPMVLYRRSSGPGLYDRIISGIERCRLAPRIIQEAPRVGAALNLVAGGMGISLVPLSLCDTQTGGVHYRPVTCKPPLVASKMLACRKTEGSQSVKNFVETVRDTMKSWDGS